MTLKLCSTSHGPSTVTMVKHKIIHCQGALLVVIWSQMGVGATIQQVSGLLCRILFFALLLVCPILYVFVTNCVHHAKPGNLLHHMPT